MRDASARDAEQKYKKIQKYNVKDAQFCGVERCLSQGCRAKREEFRTGP